MSDGVIQGLVMSGIVLGTLLCVAMTAFRLPGTWLLLGLSIGFDAWCGWQRFGFRLLAFLAGAALLAEIAETLTSAWFARRAGASAAAQWAAVLGGFAGMVFLSFLIPVPLVGTVFGALVGCFLGAAITEIVARERVGHGANVGLFAALGFAVGSTIKTGIALVMAGAVVWSAWPG